MAKQHTFKTTKGTDWLDKLLDGAENKSDYIRELVLLGLSVQGINAPTPLDKYGLSVGSHGQTLGVTVPQVAPQKVTPIPQDVTPEVRKEVTPTYMPTTDEAPPTIELGEVSIDDLEAKLNGMNSNFA